MKHTSWKPLVLVALTSLVLYGCTDTKEVPEEEEKEPATVSQGIDFNGIYEMDNDTVLVEINGQKLTVGDAKKRSFERGLVQSINRLVDTEMLVAEYEVTEAEVAKETERLQSTVTENPTVSLDEESIRYNLAFKKFVQNEVEVTDIELKEIFNKYYGSSERTFEEMKSELKEQAPTILGSELILQKQEELRKSASVKFGDASLETNLKHSFKVAPAETKEN